MDHLRIPALDGVRGLAILIVFAGHVALFGTTDAQRTQGIVRYLAAHAGTGVDLFFVLSGFLITGILYDSKGSRNYFRRFFSRRVLRIFPLYYSVLAVVAIASLLFPDLFALKTITLSAHIANWTYTSNILMAMRGWGAEPAFLGHFWSLAVEEQFYVLWPFVVLALSREKLIRICGAGVILAFIFRMIVMTRYNYESAYTLLPSRMDALLIGAAVALLARGEGGIPGWVKSPILSGSLLAAYVYSLVVGVPGVLGANLGFTIEPLTFGALLVALVYRERLPVLKAFFTSRFLRFFGKYSYAIYVFHLAVIVSLPALIKATYRQLGIAAGAPGIFAFGVIALLITVAAAVISWTVLEKRALALKDRLVFTRSSLANESAPSYVS